MQYTGALLLVTLEYNQPIKHNMNRRPTKEANKQAL